MDVQNIIQSQLDQFYSVISQERDNRVKVRNWSITIWLAYLALLGSGQFNTDKWTASLILAIIIIIFWFVEGFHQSLVLVNEGRAKKLEKLLSDNQDLENVPLELFYESGYYTIKKWDKAKCFLLACFTGEPILFFHIAMIAGSSVFIYYTDISPKVGTVIK